MLVCLFTKRQGEHSHPVIAIASSLSNHFLSSNALGQGWRLGFLGTLHMDVFRQRLEEEYEANVIVTQPTVPYKVVYRNGEEKIVRNPSEFPSTDEISTKVQNLLEPMVSATMIFPEEYMGQMMDLCGVRSLIYGLVTFVDGTH
jgi:translation elongation factor EF-4